MAEKYSGIAAGNQVNASDMEAALDRKEDVSNKTTSLSASSTDAQYPSAKAVRDAIQKLMRGTLWISSSLTSTKITWYEAVRTCVRQTHSASDVPAAVKAEMNDFGYTTSIDDEHCLLYQLIYAMDRKKVYRLPEIDEWQHSYFDGKLEYHSQREWVWFNYGDHRTYEYYLISCDYPNMLNYGTPNRDSSMNVNFPNMPYHNFGFRLARMV
ncbi:MAG: hypothetical protein LBQ83_03475 [Candidatus Margulisbacteria bacterium]|jgi:hypothetical protein|nr:hypothetical protein [Candidatus Margulisiibacteriota bacterium]